MGGNFSQFRNSYLVLNPSFRITKQKSTIILHSAEVVRGYVRSISPLEAAILASCDGSKTYKDIVEIINSIATTLHLSIEDKKNLLIIFQDYIRESIVIDIKKPKSLRVKKYDPYSFLNANITPKYQIIRLDRPIGFTYIVTLRCLFQCRYCYANTIYSQSTEGENLIELDRLKDIIAEAAELDIHSIALSGGEPFLRTDLIEILEYMLSKDIYPTLSTRSIPKETIRQLKEIGVNNIQISLDSSIPETVDFLTGVKGSFTKTFDTIRSCIKYGINIRINSVLTSYNIKQMPSLIAFANNSGITEVYLAPYVRSLTRHRDELFPSKRDYQWLSSCINELKIKYPKLSINYSDPIALQSRLESCKIHKFTRCSAGRYGFIMLPNGEVTICEQLTNKPFIVGDLKKQSILEIWESSQMLRFIFPPRSLYKKTKCFSCEEFDKCSEVGRCYVRSMLAYNRIWAPDPFCPEVRTDEEHFRLWFG